MSKPEEYGVLGICAQRESAQNKAMLLQMARVWFHLAEEHKDTDHENTAESED